MSATKKATASGAAVKGSCDSWTTGGFYRTEKSFDDMMAKIRVDCAKAREREERGRK